MVFSLGSILARGRTCSCENWSYWPYEDISVYGRILLDDVMMDTTTLYCLYIQTSILVRGHMFHSNPSWIPFISFLYSIILGNLFLVLLGIRVVWYGWRNPNRGMSNSCMYGAIWLFSSVEKKWDARRKLEEIHNILE